MGCTLEQLKSIKLKYGIAPIYRLRWVFHFRDKPTRRGGWNSSSTTPRDMAAFINKENLFMAVIEGERIDNYSIKKFVEIDGWNYVSTSWFMGALLPVFVEKPYTSRGDVLGLSMTTRDEVVTIFVNGSCKTRKLTDKEKQFKLHEHSLGV